jgi:hypothetical protein
MGLAAEAQEGGDAVKLKLAPEDPLVKEALSGVYRSFCKKLFFRISEGVHQKVSVARELAHLDITHDNRKSLIRSYLFEELPYASERMKAKAAAAAKIKQPRAKLIVEDGDSYDDFTGDELQEDVPEEEVKTVNSRTLSRYSLVETNSGLWGCHDGNDGDLTLFHTQAEARDLIYDLIHGGSGFKAFYRRQELACKPPMILSLLSKA